MEKVGEENKTFMDINQKYALDYIKELFGNSHKIEKMSDDNKVLKHCHTQSFLVNDEYFFITSSVEENINQSKLKRYKSILNIQMFDRKNKSVKKIYQTELNNLALNQYLVQGKQFIVYQSHLYYYKIENNLEEKKVTYKFCRFHFSDDFYGEGD